MNPSPPAASPRLGRWLALALALALAGFTFVCWRDASRSPVQPAAGGTFVGRDVDGRLVLVNLFEAEYADSHAAEWQGWLYREGLGQAKWFNATNRAHPWRATAEERELDDGPKPPESVVSSTTDPRQVQAILPRLGAWGNDTTMLTRQFEHLRFRRVAGLRLGRLGGTQEFIAQFPRLPETNAFFTSVQQAMLDDCESGATHFTCGAFSFWKDIIKSRELPGFNRYQLTANWQMRLLTTNLASFSVWSYDASGGNGNHSHWRGANFLAMSEGVRELRLAELFRPELDWKSQLRARCVPKLKAISAPPGALAEVVSPDTKPDVFTLSPTGLQIYFNPYAIASGADGEFIVHFDYAELKYLLRSDGPATFLPRTP